MTSDGSVYSDIGVCRVCGKKCYITRKAAKRAIRILYPGDAMTAYACDGYFHIGHMPEGVIRGKKERWK